MATTDSTTQKPPGPVRPFYRSTRFWLLLALTLAFLLLLAIFTFGPKAVLTFWTSPDTYKPIAAVAGGLGLIYGAFSEKLKGIREKANTAADRAEVVSDKVDATNERTDLLDTRYEALSNMAYQLTQDLQQERDKSEVKIDRLETRLEGLTKRDEARQQEIIELKTAHKKEIASMNAQLVAMGAENTADKKELAVLRSRVTELEKQVAVLSAENSRLQDENHELKVTRRQRVTDQLPPLPE
jgi:polyhydroxyalkanoate synthesis regulator phasin